MMWVALGVAITLSLIAGYYVGLAIGQRQLQMRHELRSLIDREVKTWWVSNVPDAPSQVARGPGGNESSTERWSRDEATNASVCPKGEQKLRNRTSDKSNGISGDICPEPGAGEGNNERSVGVSDFVTFHHYIPRDQIKEWEALGWKVTELGPYHDQFSVLGEWTGNGKPIKP